MHDNFIFGKPTTTEMYLYFVDLVNNGTFVGPQELGNLI